MKTLLTTITGQSGSGKTFYRKANWPNAKVASHLPLRKEEIAEMDTKTPVVIEEINESNDLLDIANTVQDLLNHEQPVILVGTNENAISNVVAVIDFPPAIQLAIFRSKVDNHGKKFSIKQYISY